MMSFGFGGIVPDCHDEHLVNAVAIHVHDLKTQAVPLKVVSRFGHTPKAHDHEAGQRVVGAPFFTGEASDGKDFFELDNRERPVEQPRAVLALDGNSPCSPPPACRRQLLRARRSSSPDLRPCRIRQ